jgi:hypothetical protein
MKNKQEQIEAKKVKPIEVGDIVKIEIPYSYTEEVVTGKGKKKVFTKEIKNEIFHIDGKVINIDGNLFTVNIGSGGQRIPSEIDKLLKIKYEGYSKIATANKEFVKPTIYECGSNPFKKETFQVNFFNQEIFSLLFKACYGKRDDNFLVPNYSIHGGDQGKKPQFVNKTHGGVNFNPFVIDKDGNKQFYQRDLVWSLEQKQLLIDSIYNNIEIGKFLFRYRTWEHIEQGMLEDGHGFSWDCVDGKQRFHAILHFIQNKFPDSYGNYFKDLSEVAQNKFLGYRFLSYGEMGETAKDSDVIETFLTMNFSGVPQSKEHLEFVKDIYSKI